MIDDKVRLSQEEGGGISMDTIPLRHKKILYVATDEELKNEHYYRRLIMAARNLPISRRDWPDEISFFFLDCELNGIELLYMDDTPYTIPLIDDYLSDAECRLLSQIFQLNELGVRPKQKSRKLELLRIIDIFLRGSYPKISEYIRK